MSSKELINGEVRERADKIKDSFDFDSTTGVVSLKSDRKPFIETLPEHVTEETVKDVMTAIGDFAVGAGVAFGEVALEGLEKNQNLSQIVTTIPLTGDDKITLRMDREKHGVSPRTKEEYTKKGSLSSSVTLHGVSTSRGTMKKVAKFFSEEAATRL